MIDVLDHDGLESGQCRFPAGSSDGDGHLGTLRAHDLGRDEADRAGADDERAQAADRTHAVEAAEDGRGRLREDGITQVHTVRHAMQVPRREADQLRGSAVEMPTAADLLAVGTPRDVPGSAELAVGAAARRPRDPPRPGCPGGRSGSSLFTTTPLHSWPGWSGKRATPMPKYGCVPSRSSMSVAQMPTNRGATSVSPGPPDGAARCPTSAIPGPRKVSARTVSVATVIAPSPRSPPTRTAVRPRTR